MSIWTRLTGLKCSSITFGFIWIQCKTKGSKDRFCMNSWRRWWSTSVRMVNYSSPSSCLCFSSTCTKLTTTSNSRVIASPMKTTTQANKFKLSSRLSRKSRRRKHAKFSIIINMKRKRVLMLIKTQSTTKALTTSRPSPNLFKQGMLTLFLWIN